MTFDPLQWDLNPEGIGVQPMLCKVSLNFKFIGGSSLGGPITELQNAVSYNFFANTGVYNRRKKIQGKDQSRLVGDDEQPYEFNFDYGAYINPSEEKGPAKEIKVDPDVAALVEADFDRIYGSGKNTKESGLSDEEKKAIEENDAEEGVPDAHKEINLKKRNPIGVRFGNQSGSFTGGATGIQYTKMWINIEKENGKYFTWILKDKDERINNYDYSETGNPGISVDITITDEKGNTVPLTFDDSSRTDRNGLISTTALGEYVTDTETIQDPLILGTTVPNQDPIVIETTSGKYVMKVVVKDDYNVVLKEFTETFDVSDN
jgi:hypothetical protein